MVISDRDLGRAFFRPTENKAPLVVDPNGMKAGPISFERFEPVAGRHGKVLAHTGPVDLKKFPQGDAGNRREAPVLFLVEKLLGVAVGKGLDHERGDSTGEGRRGSATPPYTVARMSFRVLLGRSAAEASLSSGW